MKINLIVLENNAGLNELEFMDGTPFGSLYHIHPERGPMEGGTHSQTLHSYLRFVRNRNETTSLVIKVALILEQIIQILLVDQTLLVGQ